jgi:hypothetical protein
VDKLCQQYSPAAHSFAVPEGHGVPHFASASVQVMPHRRLDTVDDGVGVGTGVTGCVGYVPLHGMVDKLCQQYSPVAHSFAVPEGHETPQVEFALSQVMPQRRVDGVCGVGVGFWLFGGGGF